MSSLKEQTHAHTEDGSCKLQAQNTCGLLVILSLTLVISRSASLTRLRWPKDLIVVDWVAPGRPVDGLLTGAPGWFVVDTLCVSSFELTNVVLVSG